jgi:Ca-activated chloride channel family protein
MQKHKMFKTHSNIEKNITAEKSTLPHSLFIFKSGAFSNVSLIHATKNYVPMWFIICLFISFNVQAQEEKKIVYNGNKSFYAGKPIEAANSYKKALKEKQDYYKANFNLGAAYYKTADLIRTGKIPSPDKRMTADSAANIIFNQAAEQFDVVAKSVSNADTIQKAWHNYGNAKLMQKSFEDAILGYKKALKLNPKDEDTRYNLAYAQRELKKQQDQQKKNDKDKKDDKKDGDKPEDKKDKGEKDKKDINNPNDKDKQEAQQPQMSKEQAEKMLNALKNDEKKMQALRKKKGDPAQKVKVEKDW